MGGGEMIPLCVLIGCEESGAVRRAFAALGHDAWSCDLKPSADGSNRHIWAALVMHMSVPDMKEQLYQALRVRLGRRPIATEKME